MAQTDLRMQRTNVFRCSQNVEHLTIDGKYVCYICVQNFANKDEFDLHFQQQIPRDRILDKHVRELHLSHLDEDEDLDDILSVSIKRGNIPNVNMLVVRNLTYSMISINHMYMFNSEYHSHFNSESISIKSKTETQITLPRGCVAMCDTNYLVARICLNHTVLVELHELTNICCVSSELFHRRMVPKREISEELYNKYKIARSSFRFHGPDKPTAQRTKFLTTDNYRQTLNKASMIEQINQMLDLESYRRKIRIRSKDIKEGNMLTLFIKNAEDELSQLTVYDSIHITRLDIDGPSPMANFNIKRIVIDTNTVRAEFKFQIHPGLYDVEFVLCTCNWDIEAQVLDATMNMNVIRFLFPDSTDVRQTVPPQWKDAHSALTWQNEDIKQNINQMQAVLNVVRGTAFPYPYVIYGPPGTGKTKTLVEAIYQIVKTKPKSRILVCANSNSAADDIAIRLNHILPNTCPFNHNVYRLYAKAYHNMTKVDPELLSFSNYCLGLRPHALHFDKYRVVVGTLMCAGSLNLGVVAPEFSHVFIDECGAATESATLVPLACAFGEGIMKAHIILAGDPQQLGPVVRSQDSIGMGFDISMLERLLNTRAYSKDPHTKRYNPNIITKLTLNYRSHPAIFAPSNILFYDKELLAEGLKENTHCYLDWNWLPNPKFPVIFHALTTTLAQKDFSAPSWYNYDEIGQILEYVNQILTHGINGTSIAQEDIGVITPYKKQCLKLQHSMKNRNWNDITVSSVEMFQGKEKPIIIISTVRSNMGIGFLNNQKRLNVMMTRAKALMIIIGNPLTLQKDRHWNQLLQILLNANVCTGDPFHFSLATQNKANVFICDQQLPTWHLDLPKRSRPSMRLPVPSLPVPQRFSVSYSDIVRSVP